MKTKLLFCLLLGACTNINQPKFEGESLLDVDTFYCPKDKVKYCEGRHKNNLECGCVTQQSLSRAFEFLR